VRLYSGSSAEFVQDSVCNRVSDKLREAFEYSYRRSPGPAEVGAWRNSLRAMSQIIEHSGLNDQGVILEYELPLSSKRLDCMVLGRDDDGRDQAVIVELKQWEKCSKGFGDKVVTFVGGARRDVLHPSVQVMQYRTYLQDAHTAFYEGDSPIGLSSCAYLHNYPYESRDPLFDTSYRSYLETDPLFTGDDVSRLEDYLIQRVSAGHGAAVLQRVETSKYRPSKQLLDHVGKILEGKDEYILLDDQLIAFERVLFSAVESTHSRKKTVILVRGGPGTGKSVIALNLLARLSRDGFRTHYVTGSRAFTATLKEIVGRRAAQMCKNFSSYMEADADELDVMICDEAHRMWQKSKNRFIPKERQSGKLQIEELVHASRVTVFFIDDNQPVRPDEIGNSGYVASFAREKGLHLFDYTLDAQFRCMGSDAFIKWINNTLGIESTAEVTWNVNNTFEFRIFDTPRALEAEIHAKLSAGHKARMTAGFCWEWSKPKADGHLIDDVVIGDFSRPWNAKPDAGHLADEIPPASTWAFDPRGASQIGCIYTAQGFEFDYVGVIFGPDLVFREGRGWMGDPSSSHDAVVRRANEDFARLVKNTYRVLLTRGLKGCYVHFMDKKTEEHFRDRLVMGPGA
jgi:uncharacterized protein